MKLNDKKIIELLHTIATGFIGGLLFSFHLIIFHYFHIIDFHYSIILQHFYMTGEWLNKWYGAIFFMLFTSMISIIFAVIYYFTLRKISGWLVGAFIGTLLWVVFYLIIPLFFYDTNVFTALSSYTTVAMLCLSLLYGIFIGYSISYNYEISLHE